MVVVVETVDDESDVESYDNDEGGVVTDKSSDLEPDVDDNTDNDGDDNDDGPLDSVLRCCGCCEDHILYCDDDPGDPQQVQ